MLGRTYEAQNCSAARTLELVGERWSLLIIRDALFAGSTRFADFQRSLAIAPNILKTRLDGFVAAGLMQRHRYSNHPEHYEYLLTDKGRDLQPVIVALTAWGDQWAAPHGPRGSGGDLVEEAVDVAEPTVVGQDGDVKADRCGLGGADGGQVPGEAGLAAVAVDRSGEAEQVPGEHRLGPGDHSGDLVMPGHVGQRVGVAAVLGPQFRDGLDAKPGVLFVPGREVPFGQGGEVGHRE
jgi:DNA-binding HxlR family transcriptional regulator